MSAEPEQLDLYRQELLARVLDHAVERNLEDPISREWADAALRAIARLAASGALFSAEDLRREVGDPPRDAGMGVAFRRAAAAGLIRQGGYRTSTRLQRHGGVVRLWKGNNT